jgi:hypothetical protein
MNAMSPWKTRTLAAAFLFVAGAPAAPAEIPSADLVAAIDLLAAGLEPEAEVILRGDAERAVAGGTDPTLLADVILRAREHGATPEEIASLVRRAASLAGEQLPSHPVLDRYLQGTAKEIPFARINAVADDLELRLRESAALLDETYPRGEVEIARETRFALIDHCAYALGVGTPADQVRAAIALAAHDELPPGDARAPVLAMGCLVGGGLGADRSFEVVREAWRHGYRGGDLEHLGQGLGGLGRPGAAPDARLIDEVIARIRSGHEHGVLFRFLEELHARDRHHLPGVGPDDDPGFMHGPGGHPDAPGRQGPHGHEPGHHGGDDGHTGGR